MLRWAGVILVAATVVRELRKPEEERTWHGHVLGFVPYDFRPPTFERLRDAFWNPRNERILVGEPFGIGWTVNLYQVQRRLLDAAGW
ncbi:MAG: hypothetical protein HY332_25500 [Chloroflexi bacterium]|nr:hypothetical protein [Chloroflexota bacterium]